MSYILDALRKLEQNRLHEEAVTFLAFQGQQPAKPRKRRLCAYLLVAALFANAGVIVWWIGFRSPSQTSLPARTQALPEAKPAGPAAPSPAAEKEERGALVQGVSSRPVAEPFQRAEQGIQAAQPASTSASAVQKTSAAGRAPSGTPSRDSEPRPIAPKPPLPPAPVPRQASLDKPLPAAEPSFSDKDSSAPGQAASPLPESVSKPVPATIENASPGLRVREATPPPDGRVLRSGDLPPTVAAHIPSLKISLHYFIAEPRSRFVLINDRLLREDEYLSEGLKVEQINQGDVIMNYRGWRFQIGLDEGR